MNPILEWLAQNTLVVACCVPPVWLLCRWLRHRPAEQHLLWLLLLVKLLTPPSAAPSWSLPAPEFWRSSPTPSAEAELARPERIPLTNQRADVFRLPAESTVIPALMEEQHAEEQPIASHSVTAPEVITASASVTNRSFSVGEWLCPMLLVVWLIGSSLVLMISLRRIWALRRMLQDSDPAGPTLEALVQKQASQLKLRHVRVRVVRRAAGPVVTCLGRPCLLWPGNMTSSDMLQRSRAIIAHELAHIRRRDHYVLWLEYLGGLIWWWNPLFWVVRRGLHESREMACDAMALRGASDTRRDYAELLLEITAAEKPSHCATPAFGAGKLFSGSLQRRLEMVFNERASGSISAMGALLVLAIAVLAIPRWSIGQDTPEAAPLGLPTAQVTDPPATTPSTPLPGAPVAPTTATDPSAALPQVNALPQLNPDKEASFDFLLDQGSLRIRVTADGKLLLQITEGDRVSEHVLSGIMVQPQQQPAVISETIRGNHQIASGTPSIDAPSPSRVPTVVGTRRAAEAVRHRTPPQRFDRAPAAPHDLDLLRVESDLATIGVKKKQVQLEELQRVRQASPESVSEKDLLLAELELQEAELQLRKCNIMLQRAEQRQAGPNVAR